MSISNPVRLVLFDVDGTLGDHDGAAALGRKPALTSARTDLGIYVRASRCCLPDGGRTLRSSAA
jgi:FMN phosphatase YigB (HAD superfamily)